MSDTTTEGKLWLVTGGAGFIGKHLVDAVVEKDDRVRIVDNFSASQRYTCYGALQLIEADVCDTPQMIRAMEGVDYVVHLAAISNGALCHADPREANRVNVQGTHSVLAAAVDAGVRRVVFASSAAVYGNDDHLRQREGREGICSSEYALTKQAGEIAVRQFGKVALDAVALRFFNVYGPGGKGVVDRMARDRAQGRTIEIDGDGQQVRDFIRVADVVRAIIAAAERPEPFDGPVNVGTGHGTSINELFNMTGGGRWYSDRVDGGVKRSVADVSRMKVELGVEAMPFLEAMGQL